MGKASVKSSVALARTSALVACLKWLETCPNEQGETLIHELYALTQRTAYFKQNNNRTTQCPQLFNLPLMLSTELACKVCAASHRFPRETSACGNKWGPT